MMDPKKPSSLLYGVTENPPLWITTIQGFQHVCVYAITLIFPVVIVREAGGSVEQASFLVSMSMVAGGIGVIVQSFSKGPIGAGYLCPQVCGPSFLTASILAAKTGGLSLVLGMTTIAGVLEALFSRVIRHLRFLFPPEITGFIVAMVGITVVRFASLNFLGLDSADHVTEARELCVALLTLGLMVGLNIWSKGKLKLFCVLVGMMAGYAASYAFGLIGDSQLSEIGKAAVIWFPLSEHPGWSFNFYLLIPFVIAMLCSSLKSIGDLTTCQKVNDDKWKRPDMQNISKGILADAIGCAAGGVLGGMGQSTSSTNIGLSIATGVTSRVLAYSMGGILIGMSFFPKLSAVFAIMPKPVMGATLIFALSFMVIAGLQIVMSRMIDARKTFIIGISLIFGLTVDLMPEAFTGVHPWISPIFSSSLSTGALTAVILNLIFRIGIAKKVRLELAPEVQSSERLFEFMEKTGGLWGAREEVIMKCISAVNEFLEAVVEHEITHEPINLEVSFDEFNLDAFLQYRGEPLEFPSQRPDASTVLTDVSAQLKLSAFLIRQYANKVNVRVKNGTSVIHLNFDH